MKVLSIFVIFVAFFVAAAHPQQPRWNWEEVILSRNGPSTTTSPRPKTWTTTTLRSFGVAPVRVEGSVGTVEDASIIPRQKYAGDVVASNARRSTSFIPLKIYLFVICTLLLRTL